MPFKIVMESNVIKISTLNRSKGSLESDITGVKKHQNKRDAHTSRLRCWLVKRQFALSLADAVENLHRINPSRTQDLRLDVYQS